MDSWHGIVVRMNVEGDRLSILPGDLIHKILSSISIKYAIQTSVLSSRWRFIWRSMVYLNFSSDDFTTFHKFSEFVTHTLSRRDDQIRLSSVKLSFPKKFSKKFLKRILNYALSHNVQQLTFSSMRKNMFVFPLLCSRSLKYLKLIGRTEYVGTYPLTLSALTWNLPALTTLHLNNVSFYVDYNTDKGIGLFSKCINLKNLSLNEFGLLNSNTFSICHPGLSNLKLERGHRALSFVNVVAPQLENLRIYNCWGQHLIFAPQLVSLDYKYCEPLQFFTDADLCSLEKVDLYINPYKSDVCKVVDLLQRLHNVKFLKLNLELIQFLSSEMKLISLPPSPFANLKSLKVYPTYIPLDEEAQKKEYMSNEVKSYFLDGSSSATFTMASHEMLMEAGQSSIRRRNNGVLTNQCR